MTTKKTPRRLIKAPVKLSKLEDIDVTGLTSTFSVERKSEYSLPRIAFIGYFSRLSLTNQRYISKALGFEYYKGIKFGDISGTSLQILVGKWPEIYQEFTKLIVIGNKTITGWNDNIPEMDWEFGYHLFRCYSKQTQPIYAQNQIPFIMESELFKLHPDFPNITNNTCWDVELNIDILSSTNPPKQGSLFN